MTQLYGIMVTNGGPHPADKWAEITANQIVDTILIDANTDDISDEAAAARAAKRKLRNELFEIFNSHHDGVQKSERVSCAKHKKVEHAEKHADHSQTPIDPCQHVDSIISDVMTAFAKTPWAAHLAQPQVIDLVKQIIGQHTVDVMHLERRWHHDRLVAKGA